MIESLNRLKTWFRKPRVRVAFPQKIAPVASAQELENAEIQLERTFPELLRRIYLEVGNGGFGPGFGMLGIGSGHKNALDLDLVQFYKVLEQQDESWPKWLTPLVDWGCGSFTCLDFAGGALQRYIPNFYGSDEEEGNDLFLPEEESLSSYLARWLNGEELNRPKALEAHQHGSGKSEV